MKGAYYWSTNPNFVAKSLMGKKLAPIRALEKVARCWRFGKHHKVLKKATLHRGWGGGGGRVLA